MTFWQSPLGTVTGKQEDAFAPTFTTIPDNTYALAKIDKFELKEFGDQNYYQINWTIADGEFKGRVVFQKIHAFDTDDNKQHRALNMLKLIYDLFSIKPSHNKPPTDTDLRVFIDKRAGIRIQEWERDGKTGNWVSEVHPAVGFVPEIGIKKTTNGNGKTPESAFDRQRARENQTSEFINDDVPF